MAPLIGTICLIFVGLFLLIWPRQVYTIYRNNYLDHLEGMNIKNPPDWLPEVPRAEAILAIRFFGIFTIAFMLVMLEPLITRVYFDYFHSSR